MNPLLQIFEPLGPRSFDASSLPLYIGGPGMSLVIPGVEASAAAALIGLHENRLYLQALPDHVVRLHGRILDSSVWLAPGARFEFDQAALLVHGGEPMQLTLMHDADNRTAPPELSLEPGDIGAGSGDPLTLAPLAYTPARLAQPPPARQRTRRAALAMLLIGLAAVAVTAFILGSRAVGVEVRTVPAGAAIQIEDALLAPKIAGRYWMLPGEHGFRASLPGYLPASARVDIAQSPATVRLVLIPLPNRVRVVGLPRGAQVLWDDQPASAQATMLSAGGHRLRISAPRYEPYAGRAQITGGGRLQNVAVSLVPRFARVQFISDPPGAGVHVDGAAAAAAATPATLELDAGLHQVTLESRQAKTWRGSVLVRGGVDQVVGPVRLSAPDAQLAVISVPPGADVSIGSIYRGHTPLHLALPPGLEYEVSLQRAGFGAELRRVDLRSAPSARIEVKLTPVLGEVSVSGDPADARVWLEGADLGAAGQIFRLPAAPQALEIRKAGFDTYRTTVTPKAGFSQAITYRLSVAGAKPVVTASVISSAKIGLQMKLMPTGEFEMGSNRREPARRSNEVQRRVKLARIFYLSSTEVTNAQFRKFRAEFAAGTYKGKTLDLDNQPAVNVSWSDAVEFCNWLSAQESLPPAYVKADAGWKLSEPVNSSYRLPTEAEWEFAARFDGKSAVLRYPWGMELPIAPASGNYADASANAVLDAILPNYSDGYPVSSPPGKFPASVLGLYDLGGNVAEWVNDGYTSAPADEGEVSTDPLGPAQSKSHVVRGASFRTASIAEMRLAYRDSSIDGRVDVGFRVGRYAP